MFFGKHVRLFTESYGKELEHTEKYTISLPFSGDPKAFPPKSPTRILTVVLESRKRMKPLRLRLSENFLRRGWQR